MEKRVSKRSGAVLALWVLLMLCSAPRLMLGQGTYPATVEGLTRRHSDLLFRGIVLDSVQRARADSIVRVAAQAQIALDPSASDVWSKLRQVLERRNVALRGLLTSEADRATFDSNVTRFFPPPEKR
jgi:hypothetical protein